MATRSMISIAYKNGQVKSIYCHNDGYISGNGLTLFQYFHEFALIEKMIALGDASSIERHLEPFGSSHTFDNREPSVCVFYGRDRGDYGPCRIYTSLDDYIQNGQKEEYNYVFKEKTQKWYVSTYSSKKLSLLTNVLLKEIPHNPLIQEIQNEIKIKKNKAKLDKKINTINMASTQNVMSKI